MENSDLVVLYYSSNDGNCDWGKVGATSYGKGNRKD
jgi:hypothetical protein